MMQLKTRSAYSEEKLRKISEGQNDDFTSLLEGLSDGVLSFEVLQPESDGYGTTGEKQELTCEF